MMRLLLSLLGLCFFSFAGAAGNDVIINEVAWMGTAASSNDEWIELANISDAPIDITGWKLTTIDGGVTIELQGNIAAQGFFLLERTDDTTLPQIHADQFFSGSFSNTGETLILKDATGALIDTVDASNGWPAGDNTNKDTMQRTIAGWISAPATPGTANAKTVSESPAVLPQTQQTSTQPQPVVSVYVTYPTSFYISEFFPNPKGPDEAGEWIEIYNDSDTPQSISGFFLDDIDKGSRPYHIPDITIPAKGFHIFNRSDTKIALNNTNDNVRLLYPNEQIAADISYEKAKEQISGAYNITTKEVFWTDTPTPGKANTITPRVELASNTMQPPYQQEQIKNINDLPAAASSSALQAASIPLKTQGSFSDVWIMLLSLVLGAGAMLGYMKFFRKASLILLLALSACALPFVASADTFQVLSELDIKGRSQVEADLLRLSTHSLVYVEKGITIPQEVIEDLGSSFDSIIYPRLVDVFGSPFDATFKEGPITMLLTSITLNEGGYFISSQPNIIYLNESFLDATTRAKGIVAHEFQHVIAYTQKNKRLNTPESRWINEMRSEYASTYSGFGERFLKERVSTFKAKPFDHLFLWSDSLQDYGMVSMFGHYLASRFGEGIFREEIRTNTVDRASLGAALKTFDPSATFSKIYAEWRLANYVNDNTLLGGKYGYKNDLITIRLPSEGTSSFESSLDPPQTITTAVSSFNSGAVTFHFNGNRSNVTFTTPQASPDLVVTYLRQLEDGTFSDGQATMEQGSTTFTMSKNTKAAIFLMSNTSESIPQTTFTMNVAMAGTSQPSIRTIEPVILTPGIVNTAYVIKGEEFDSGALVRINNISYTPIFQNEQTLLLTVDSLEPQSEIAVMNPDGGLARFIWNGPQSILAQSAIPEGSLIRASNDYKVYIVNKGFRRHIMSSAIFSFYGHLGFSVVKVIEPLKVQGYQESRLIRAAGDPKVYEIFSDGRKRWIPTAQEFISREFDWNAIFEVNTREINFYPIAL